MMPVILTIAGSSHDQAEMLTLARSSELFRMAEARLAMAVMPVPPARSPAQMRAHMLSACCPTQGLPQDLMAAVPAGVLPAAAARGHKLAGLAAA